MHPDSYNPKSPAGIPVGLFLCRILPKRQWAGHRLPIRFPLKNHDNFFVPKCRKQRRGTSILPSRHRATANAACCVCKNPVPRLLTRHAVSAQKTRRFLTQSTSFCPICRAAVGIYVFHVTEHQQNRKTPKNAVGAAVAQKERRFFAVLHPFSCKITDK